MTFSLKLRVSTLFVLFSISFDQGCAWRPASSIDRPEAPGASISHEFLLSEVLKGEAAGIDLLPRDERENLLGSARDYAKFRNRQFNKSQREAFVDRCLRGIDENPFCNFVLDRSDEPNPRSRHKSRLKSKPVSLNDIRFALKSGISDFDSSLKLGDFGRILKRVQSLDSIESIIRQLVHFPSCMPSGVYAAFGMKVEEGFPSASYHQYARSLYARAVECGDDEAAVQAAYRLGLLSVWDGDYRKAEELLGYVAESPAGEPLLSRALFWRQYSGRQLGDTKLETEMRARVKREFPLSIHGLLSADETELKGLSLVSTPVAKVSFRSQWRPDLNARVTAAEALHRVGFANLSDRILDPLVDQLDGAEPAFQLYIAVLFRRNGDTIRKFQLLAQIFRGDPTMISRQTLEMLYPLSIFELVRIYEEKIDPYVVISLIRQESAFNERARSPAGAMGLMQLMPSTARIFRRGPRVELFDPKVNVKVGVAFFSRLLKRYNGDVELALAAYNCGPERVDRWVRRYPIENRILFLDLLPIRETREYVASIARNYYWYLRLYQDDQIEQRLKGNREADQLGARFSVFGSRS